MPVYTIHAPVTADIGVGAANSFTFVRDGFHFWAFVAGPVWLAWHRLWLALIGWIVAITAVDAGLMMLGASGLTVFLANLLLGLLLGFEAASLQRWTLSRRNWRQLDIVVADDEESAERRFFDRWTAKVRGSSLDPSGIDRGAPPPTRVIPGRAFSRPPPLPQSEIIGSFPQPGGLR